MSSEPSPGEARVHGSCGVSAGASSSVTSFSGGITLFSISASLGALNHCIATNVGGSQEGLVTTPVATSSI